MGRFDKLMKILGLVGEETPNLVKKLTQEETDALIRAWAEKKGLPAYKSPSKLQIPPAPLSPEQEILEQAKVEKWKQGKQEYEQALSDAKEKKEILEKQKQQIEKDKELIENADILDENTPNIESIKNKMSGMALGLPIAGASTQVDMNPLKDIKAGYEAYKEFKRPYEEAAGRQFNLAGATPEVEKPMEMVSGLVSDPLMYFNGPLGVGAGALQMGIEALPSESGKENKFQKLQKMMSSKKQEGK